MGLVEDAGLSTFHELLGCKLRNSKTVLSRTLQRATKTSQSMYRTRRKTVEILERESDVLKGRWNQKFAEIAEIETTLHGFLNPASEDLKKLQEDALGQLSFRDIHFRCLNSIPFVLFAIAMFKIWVVPTMNILTPLMAWILPYIFMKVLFRLPISTEQYNQILKMMWSGNPFPTNPIEKLKSQSLWTPRSMIQTIFMVFSFAQSLIQPIQNAYHLWKTDRTMYENGQRILRLCQLYKEFQDELSQRGILDFFREPLENLNTTDPRTAIALLLEFPAQFEIALRDLADLEILWRMATSPHLRMATVIEKGDYPLLTGESILDVTLGFNAVPSNVSFTGESHHAVLTGPNGGGKSSYLRAILQCVLLSHAYGVAPAMNFIVRRFSWISSGLRLQDTPGRLSMFEREVAFASRILSRGEYRGPGLVIYDELFHSTNPPDGTLTAKKFLEELWQRGQVVSIVSTHVFDLVESAPSRIQRLACSATETPSGLEYHYEVQPGICRLSSVKSIWKRFHLFT